MDLVSEIVQNLNFLYLYLSEENKKAIQYFLTHNLEKLFGSCNQVELEKEVDRESGFNKIHLNFYDQAYFLCSTRANTLNLYENSKNAVNVFQISINENSIDNTYFDLEKGIVCTMSIGLHPAIFFEYMENREGILAIHRLSMIGSRVKNREYLEYSSNLDMQEEKGYFKRLYYNLTHNNLRTIKVHSEEEIMDHLEEIFSVLKEEASKSNTDSRSVKL